MHPRKMLVKLVNKINEVENYKKEELLYFIYNNEQSLYEINETVSLIIESKRMIT